MSKPLRSVISANRQSCAATAAALIIAAVAYFSGFAPFVDLILFDTLMNLRVWSASGETNLQVVPVDLNDRSETDLKGRLASREAFADTLRGLAMFNAQPAMDFLFEEKRPADYEFIQAVRETDTLTLAVLAVDREFRNGSYRDLSEAETEILSRNRWHIIDHGGGGIPEARTFFMPHPELADATHQLAHINVEPDRDGKYRRTPLLYKWGDGYIPSLPLAVAVGKLHIDPRSIELIPGSELILPYRDIRIRIPIDQRGMMLVPYTKPYINEGQNNRKAAGKNLRYSMDTIIRAAADPALASSLIDSFTNRIAFIADVSSGGKDYGPTAFEGVYPLSGIHIEVIGSILNLNQGSFIYQTGIAYKFFVMLVLCIIIFLIPLCKTDVSFNIFFLALFLVHTALVGIRWFFFHSTPWYTQVALVIFFAWLTVFLFRFVLRHYEQTLLKNALSRYVPKALAERILREKKTDLVPVRKVVTILFSDIVSFTKWSADKDVQLVHDFLSEYHESMADIIFAHGGTVDKYIGDGMLAFFGDPFDLVDHPMHCVEAAVAMQKKSREIKGKWKPLVDINLEVRIGINTGEAIVGNLGTKNRIEYTVIGAAVNFAQRMESNAHAGAILLARDTWEQVQSRFPSAQKRFISVKGYDDEVSAYELM